MTIPDSIKAFLDAILNCIDKRFKPQAVDELNVLAERTAPTSDATIVELINALKNLVFQLQDGAIEPSTNVVKLVRETHDALMRAWSTDSTALPADAFDELLERLDLEASGGFDAEEAGIDPEKAESNHAPHQPFELTNTLHRLQASLETIERRLRNSQTDVRLGDALDRHQHLLEGLARDLSRADALTAKALEAVLQSHFGLDAPEVSVRDDNAFHPSMARLLVACLTELISVVASRKPRSLEITKKQDSTCATLNTDLVHEETTRLREYAIKRGLVNPHSNISEKDLLPILLLPSEMNLREHICQHSALFRLLSALKADILLNLGEDAPARIVADIPQSMLLEIAVFMIDGALYGIPANSVTGIDTSPNLEELRLNQAVVRNETEYYLAELAGSSPNRACVVFIDHKLSHIALPIDQIDGTGELVVVKSNGIDQYVGGGLRLVDGRLVVLLDPSDLVHDVPVASSFAHSKVRLYVVGDDSLAQQLSPRHYQIEQSVHESDACTSIQEQKPHAVLINAPSTMQLTTLRGLAKRLDIPVLIQSDAETKASEGSPPNDTGKSISTLAELDDALQVLASQG